MAHLFVLFPTLIILAAASHQLLRSHPQTVGFYYFRNFFGLWSVCTFMAGMISVAGIAGTISAAGTELSLAPLLGAAIGVPFYYFAMAYLVRLPFAMYKKMGTLPNLLSALVVLVGISIGVGNYFVKAVGDAAVAGAVLAPAFELFAGVDYRVWTTGLFIIPAGLFFLYEASRTVSGPVRWGTVIVGLGLIGAGVGEPQHVVASHAVIADFGVAAAFAVIFVGMWLPFLLKPREAGGSYQAASA